MIAKGNVKIGVERRFGADWPGQSCGSKQSVLSCCPARILTISKFWWLWDTAAA